MTYSLVLYLQKVECSSCCSTNTGKSSHGDTRNRQRRRLGQFTLHKCSDSIRSFIRLFQVWHMSTLFDPLKLCVWKRLDELLQKPNAGVSVPGFQVLSTITQPNGALLTFEANLFPSRIPSCRPHSTKDGASMVATFADGENPPLSIKLTRASLHPSRKQ